LGELSHIDVTQACTASQHKNTLHNTPTLLPLTMINEKAKSTAQKAKPRCLYYRDLQFDALVGCPTPLGELSYIHVTQACTNLPYLNNLKIIHDYTLTPDKFVLL
jgi:hypothetical protein